MENVVRDKTNESRASPTGVGGRSRLRKIASRIREQGTVQICIGVLFATVFALRVVGQVDRSLFLWPVSAVALAFALPLWHRGWKKRAALQISAALGFLIGANIVGMPRWLACALTLLQCLDVFLGRRVLGPNIRTFDDLKKQSNILRFVTMTVAVPAVTGSLGAYPVSHFLNQPMWQTAIMSVLANSLGFAVVVPGVLLLKSGNYSLLRRPFRNSTTKAYLAAALFVVISSLVFWQNKGPFLFMIFPPMVIVLLITGLEGAVFTSLALSVIGWIGTSHGHGPIWLMKGTPLEHLLALQAFVWVCLVSALPIGALLDERRQAEDNTKSALKEKSQALDENRRLYASLKTSNDRFLAFMNKGPFASYIKDADGRMLFYNKFLAECCKVTEHAWIGLKDHEIWPVEIADSYRRQDMAVLESNSAAEFDDVFAGPDGSSIFWKTLKFPYYDGDSGQSLLAGISFDVTEEIWREAVLEDALREKTRISKKLEGSRHLLENFLHHIPSLAYVKDELGKFVFYNREVEKFFGISDTEWIGHTISEVRPLAEAEKYIGQDQQVLGCGCKIESVDEVENQDGEIRQLKSIKFAYKNIDDRMMVAKISQDITKQLKHEEELAIANRQLELLATTDSLTGLSTRRVFELRAENEAAICKRYLRPYSMVVMDVDNFKQRNDSFGHAAGDEALKTLASVIQSCVRGGDLAARLGGEEFALLLPETAGDGAMILAERIHSALLAADHGPVPLTVSIGIATFEDTASAWKDVLANADEAMYIAKHSGKNRTIRYDERGKAAVSPLEAADAAI